MSVSEIGLMPCVPVADFPDGAPDDLTGAVKMRCEECDFNVWVGPNKFKMYNERPESFRILCFSCLPMYVT